MSTVLQAMAGADEPEADEAKELVELNLRDMETGLRLHEKGRSPGAGPAPGQ